MLGLLTDGAVGTLKANTVIVNRMSRESGKHLRVVRTVKRLPFRGFLKALGDYSSLAHCGFPAQPGFDRRPFTDHMRGVARGTATLLSHATLSDERLTS